MANRDPLSGPGCEDMFLCGEYLPQYEINLLKKYPHVTYADIRKLLNSHRDQYDIPRFIRPEDVDFTPDFGWIHPIVQDTHKKLLQSILDRK